VHAAVFIQVMYEKWNEGLDGAPIGDYIDRIVSKVRRVDWPHSATRGVGVAA
jgi:hypothetical protein